MTDRLHAALNTLHRYADQGEHMDGAYRKIDEAVLTLREAIEGAERYEWLRGRALEVDPPGRQFTDEDGAVHTIGHWTISGFTDATGAYGFANGETWEEAVDEAMRLTTEADCDYCDGTGKVGRNALEGPDPCPGGGAGTYPVLRSATSTEGDGDDE